MGNDVLEFANEICATDLKSVLVGSEFDGLFKRRNYFLLDKDKFLVIKISRIKGNPFWGFGGTFFDLFNKLTNESGNYYW